MRIFWRTLNALMGLLFIFSAALQVNDPQPVRWIALYLAAALPCWLALRRTPHWAWPGTIGLIGLAWLSSYVQRGAWTVPLTDAFATWKMQNEQMLEKREMTGLLIVVGWMAILTAVSWWGRRPRPAAPRLS